jgi:hypothetical protein
MVYTGTCLRVVVLDATEKVDWQHCVTHFTALADGLHRACRRVRRQHTSDLSVANNQNVLKQVSGSLASIEVESSSCLPAPRCNRRVHFSRRRANCLFISPCASDTVTCDSSDYWPEQAGNSVFTYTLLFD